MSRSNVHLLDLPNEVLLIVLRKLNNISLIDRFCIDILPRIHHTVKYILLEPVSMERILLATVYPNLTERKLFNFEQQIVSKYFTGHNRIIDGTCVQNDILVYMPQLHSFSFYINTSIDTRDLSYNVSRENIRQTLVNSGQQNATSIICNLTTYEIACSIFSLPFAFDYLEDVGNIFPNIVFSYVTCLLVQDCDAFRYEFFVRIAQSFPLLKYLRIFNIESRLPVDPLTLSSDHSQSYTMVEYLHLTSLDVGYSHKDYLEQFLNETKA
ncbi:unnamed protein product [Rotaria socialis]|uniref:F-box domain-containing protein n=1 Tax=Rotaria socialis TaxID=392032 RepID=A0A819ZS83_9BILA|nr:unnamed protein product [Rotaria socialis]CAF3341816.1 unnamed protein product [Rotaria socialis]CAF4178724.1 unnamed protein product [Rotaria socialis]CAF4261069.1 unnamed protein product [Rotaria socialis]